MYRNLRQCIFGFIPLLLLTSCYTAIYKESITVGDRDTIPGIYFSELVKVDNEKRFLPTGNNIILHLKNGEMYVLEAVKIDSTKTIIEGIGYKRDINRFPISKIMNVSVAIRDIAVIEWNKTKQPGAIAGITLASVINTAVSIFCIASPKSCYGSCPTYYASNGDKMVLMGEGFSSSIAPSLEATDIDALYFFKPTDNKMELLVTNEAYETHLIRQIELIAVPKNENERVIESIDNELFITSNFQKPNYAHAEEGDITDKISYYDFNQRSSFSDTSDLNLKEEILMEFPNTSSNPKALAISYRQSLLTTFLFYQGLGYMGSNMGYWFAELERGNPAVKNWFNKMQATLGGIKAFVKINNNWVETQEINENGPLATNINLIKLPDSLKEENISIKLKMTKGLWRLDMVNLVDIKPATEKIILKPQLAIKNNILDNDELTNLIDKDKYIVNQAGDSLSLNFTLPNDFKNYEYFVSSTGYYFEWQRDEWIKEENAFKLFQMFSNIDYYLKSVAKDYKIQETSLENLFWRSKYEKY